MRDVDKFILFALYGVRVMKLGDIGQVKSCKEIKNFVADGIPVFKIGTMEKEPDQYITKEEYDNAPVKPTAGSVLISTDGTIGKVWVYDGEPALFSHIVWLDNDESVVLNKYLYYFYQTMPWKIDPNMPIPHLGKKLIENTEIQVPPMEMQKQIIEELESLEAGMNNIKVDKKTIHEQFLHYRNSIFEF